MSLGFHLKTDITSITVPWMSCTIPSPSEPLHAAAPDSSSYNWNLELDRATHYCVLYWTDRVPGGPIYNENLYIMTVEAVPLSWNEVHQAIRRSLESLPGMEYTFTQANEKALEYFRLYRTETINRGGDWNKPFLRNVSPSHRYDFQIPENPVITPNADTVRFQRPTTSFGNKRGFSAEQVKSVVMLRKDKKRKAADDSNFQVPCQQPRMHSSAQFNQSQPALNQSQPPLNQSQPPLNQSQPPPRKKIVCYYYAYTREGCRKGSKCPNLHANDPGEFCRPFQSRLGCLQGDKCRLVHAMRRDP